MLGITRRTMAVLLGLSLTVAFVGCSQRDKKPLPESDADAQEDVADVSQDLFTDLDESDGETISEVDTAPDTALPPALSVCLSTKAGCLEEPVSGEALELDTAQHDIDGNATGLQVRFKATVENVPVGTRLELQRDGALVYAMDVPGPSFDLANTTLNHAAAPNCPVYTVRIPSLDLSASFTVCADTGGCAPKLVPSSPYCQEFDANPGLAGFQMEFTVTSLVPGCDVAWLSWGTESIAPRPLGNGSAVIQVTLAQAGTVTCQEVEVVAHVSDSANPEREETVNAIFSLTNTLPMVEVTAPTAGTLNAAADEDSDLSNGLDVLLTGTVDLVHADAQVALWVQRPGSSQFQQEATAPAMGGAFEFAVKLAETGPYQFKVLVADCCGHVGEAVYSTIAILDTSDLRVLSPYDGTILVAKQNGPAGTDTVYDVPFVVQAPAVGIGELLEVECRPNPPGSAWTLVGSVAPSVLNEDYILVIPTMLDTAIFGSQAVCRARFSDGDSVSQSPYVQLDIGLPPPVLQIGQPEPGDLVDPGEWIVSGQSRAKAWKKFSFQILTGGQLVTEGDLDVDLEIAAESGFSTPVVVGTLFDGTYTLALEGEDVFGNLASEQAGNNTSVEVYVDSLPPELTALSPFLPFSVCTPPSCVDSVSLRAGHQVDIRVKVTGEQRADLTEVCLDSNGGSPLCSMALLNGASWEAVFSGVTLLPGENQLHAVGIDGLGHESELDWVVTLSTLAPRVELFSPAQDLVTGSPTLTILAAVKDPGTLAPLEDAAVALMVNGASVATGTHVGGGVYEMNVSGLVADVPAEVQVSAADSAFPDNVGYSDIRRVTWKSLAPSIQLTDLPDGALINLAFEGCAPGVPGCKLSIAAKTSHVEEDQTALLTGDCLSSPVLALVKNNLLVFKSVPLPDNTTCILEATVVDAAGQTASSGPVQVTIDRTGPRLCKFEAPSVGILPAEWDENLAQDGFQYTIRVAADRLEAGQQLKLTIAGPSGNSQELFLTTASAVNNPACSVFTFSQATLEYGINSLTLTTQDDANNAAVLVRSTEFSETTTLAEFYITSYVAPNACTSSSTCGQGVCGTTSSGQTCMLGWRAAAQALAAQTFPVSLFSGFGAIRLCSDHPGLTGEACGYTAEGNYRVVKTFDSVGGFQTLELTKTQVMNLPQGLHRMVLEAKRADNGQWLSSLQSPKELNRYRTVFVDTAAPIVGDIQFPSDTVAPVGTLNATEVSGGGTFPVTVQLGDAVGGAISVWANGSLVGTFPVAGNTFDIYVPYGQGANNVCAIVTDLVGNQALDFCKSITVDTLGPLAFFQAPVSSPLLEGSSPDVKVYTDATGQTVILERNVSGSFVEVSGKQAGGNGIALFPGAMLSDGVYEFRASVGDASGNSSVAVTSPKTVVVDRTPPTLAILLPTQLASLAPVDDASATLGGFQVTVLFNTTDVANWQIETVRCGNASFTNCEAPVKKEPVSVIDGGNGQYSAIITMGNLVNPIEYRRIVVKASDSNGNTRLDQVDILITAGGCTVAFADIPESGYWNNLACDIPGADCTEAQVPINVAFFGPCGDVTGVELLINGGSHATVPGSPTGGAGFLVPVQHGETLTVEARLVSSGGPTLFSTGQYGIEADFQAPTLIVLSPATSPFVCNVDTDLNANSDGCQAEIETQFMDGNLVGGSAAIWQLGAAQDKLLGEIQFTTTPQTQKLEVSLDEIDSGFLSVEAVDAAGNVGDVSIGLTVDVTPPVEVKLEPIDTSSDVYRRLPAATLNWTTPGDDGLVGQAQSYEIRYSRSPITQQAQFDAACDVNDLYASQVPPIPTSPGLVDFYTVTGPDLRSPEDPCLFRVQTTAGARYYFAVQAVDNAGNRSPITATSSASTDGLSLKYVKVDRGSLSASGVGSFVFAAGDIEGDGAAEMIIGGDPSLQGFCVVKGGNSLPGTVELSEAPSDRVRCIKDAYNSDVGRLGCSVGDVNGDGFRDFLTRVVFTSTGSPITHYRLYLGNTFGFLDPTHAALFIVDNTKITTSFACGGLGNVNGDSAPNGKPLSDFALSGGGHNVLFIVPGNTAFASTSPVTIDLTDLAQRSSWNVARVTSPDATPGVDFGANTTFVGNILPDVGGGTYDDILVTQYGPPTAAFLIPGGAWTGAKDFAVSFNLSGAAADDLKSVKLVSSTPAICNYGLGDELVGGRDLDGDTIPDLALTHPCYDSFVQNSHYVFWGADLAASQGQSLSIGTVFYIHNDVYAGPAGYRIKTNTYSLGALSDFDGSGPVSGTSEDLVFGDFNGLGSSYGHIYVRFNDGGNFNPSTLYPYVDLTITDPFTPGSPLFANRVVTPGDVSGDGNPDILVSTEGLGYAVLVY